MTVKVFDISGLHVDAGTCAVGFGKAPASHVGLCARTVTPSRPSRWQVARLSARRRSRLAGRPTDELRSAAVQFSGGVAAAEGELARVRSTAPVTATSIVTFASVRNMSGTGSTAISIPSGAIGTPIAIAIGAIDVK